MTKRSIRNPDTNRLVDADGSVGKKIVEKLKKEGKQVKYQDKPEKPTKSSKKSAPTTSVPAEEQQIRPPDVAVTARLLGHGQPGAYDDAYARAIQQHQAFLRAMRQSRQLYQAQKAKEMEKQAQQHKKMQQQQKLAKQRQKQDLKRDMKQLRVKKLAQKAKEEELRKQQIQQKRKQIQKSKQEQEKKRKQDEENKRREQSKKRAEALKKRFADGNVYHLSEFHLENGEILSKVNVCYNTYGRLNSEKSNVIIVCHPFTGNSSLHTWWESILGPDKALDTSEYFIVCLNALGSCYGTTGPTSVNPVTGHAYGMKFPSITIRDTVRLHIRVVKEELKIKFVQCVIGGSFGGMQALEWVLCSQENKAQRLQSNNLNVLGTSNTCTSSTNFHLSMSSSSPSRPTTTTYDYELPIGGMIAMVCGGFHTAWQIGVSETQRQAIYADTKWNEGNIDQNDPPQKGLEIARMIAMFTYRTNPGFQKEFGRDREIIKGEAGDKDQVDSKLCDFKVKKYLEYQGKKFFSRFDAMTYVKLSEQMDTHDVGRYRGGMEKALKSINIPCCIIGVNSDILYPIHEQKELQKNIPNSKLVMLDSIEGHDGFLLETEKVGCAIKSFLADMRKKL